MESLIALASESSSGVAMLEWRGVDGEDLGFVGYGRDLWVMVC